MDAGSRKFPLYQPGSAGGAVSAIRGSSLSSLSSAGSDDTRVSAARLGLGDVDWTVKYLTSDQARSSPFTVTSRLLRTSDELLSPGARAYDDGTRSSYYGAPVVTSAMRRTEGDLDVDRNRHGRTVSSMGVNHSSLPPLHLSRSVDDYVTDDVSVTSYRDTVPRRTFNNYTPEMSNGRVSYHPMPLTMPPAVEHRPQLSITQYSSLSAEPKSTKMPGMSMARRKIRRTLCRSKGDPNYFDI